jgi:hypothetical protein
LRAARNALRLLGEGVPPPLEKPVYRENVRLLRRELLRAQATLRAAPEALVVLPIASASARPAAAAAAGLQPASATSAAMRIPEAPTTAPTERSNSPPIISSATPAARMPRGAAAFRTVTAPSTERNEGPATAAKSTQSPSAPAAAARGG